jgi:hypothetical protein
VVHAPDDLDAALGELLDQARQQRRLGLGSPTIFGQVTRQPPLRR